VERAGEPRSDRGRGNAEHPGQLARPVAEHVAQHYERALVRVERPERGHQLGGHLVGRRPGLRAGRQVAAHLGPALPRLHPVERAVDDDAVQPGPERPPAVEAVDRAHRGEHRLLGDVLGRGSVLHDQERRPVRRVPVAPDQRLDRIGGAVPGLAFERGLVPPARGAPPRSHWDGQRELLA
jgi:hypothetical protein